MDQQSIDYCRICLASNQEDDFVCLLTDLSTLSGTGRMYEDLFGISILIDKEGSLYPQYLCHSCELQLKLFMKLKIKAEKAMHLFKQRQASMCLDEDVANDIKCESDQEENLEFLQSKVESETLDESYQEDSEETDLQADADVKVDIDTDVYSNEENDCNVLEFHEVAIEEVFSDNPDHIAIDDDLNDDVQYLEDYDELPKLQKTETVFVDMKGKHNTKESLKYSCADCDEKFRLKSQLLTHRRTVHAKIKKIQCNECFKTVYSEEAFKVHMNMHLGLPAYKCELCGKTFNQKAHYNYHMANHRNERNVKCELCAKGFLTKSDLKIHMRSHTDERRYQCDVCGKEFRAYSHMKNHRYSHFEKEFECPICFQKYISPNTLRTHVKTIHMGEIPYECEYCEKKFKRKHHLIAHYKTHRLGVC